MICCKYHVTEGSNNNKWLVDSNEVTRPAHRLLSRDYKHLLADIYDDMSPDVEHAMEYVSDQDNVNFIDYRYRQEELVSNQEYQEFLKNFQLVFHYLQGKKREL